MNTWRARCGESRTSGSESGPQKPTSRNADSALRPDFYTEHWTGEGKLYLCTFKDVWSNRIVGYSIADRMTAGPAVAAISNAAALRDMAFAGVIVHTDRGSQFRSRKFVLRLKDQKMIGSMGRVGAAGDNAAAESFFSLQQTTCSIANDGQHATDYASRSSPGSKPPITADANNEASANSPQYSSKQSTNPPSGRNDISKPEHQPKSGHTHMAPPTGFEPVTYGLEDRKRSHFRR